MSVQHSGRDSIIEVSHPVHALIPDHKAWKSVTLCQKPWNIYGSIMISALFTWSSQVTNQEAASCIQSTQPNGSTCIQHTFHESVEHWHM